MVCNTTAARPSSVFDLDDSEPIEAVGAARTRTLPEDPVALDRAPEAAEPPTLVEKSREVARMVVAPSLVNRRSIESISKIIVISVKHCYSGGRL
jgi:hypothetical protein